MSGRYSRDVKHPRLRAFAHFRAWRISRSCPCLRSFSRLADISVVSKHSVSSEWVEKEVETAMEKERQQKRVVLFPIRLDDAVMKIETGWPAEIRRSRHIGEFKKWKSHDSYKKAFDRLLRDLKSEQSTGAKPG